MPFDPTLAERTRKLVRGRDGFVEKQMFGGTGFLKDGNMCCGIWKEFLIARVGKDAAPKLLNHESIRVFDITGRPMGGWLMVHRDEVKTDEALAEWVDRCHAFVETLPPK